MNSLEFLMMELTVMKCIPKRVESINAKTKTRRKRAKSKRATTRKRKKERTAKKRVQNLWL